MPNFPVGSASDLTSALATINAAAATNTAYTITLSASISLDSASLDLDTGSSVEFEGPFGLFITAFAVIGAVTMDLNYTGTITLDGGSVDNVALTTNGGGTVVAGNFSGEIVGTVGDGGDGAVNDGTITYAGTSGAVDFDTGTVQNGWDGTTAALISGTEVGVEIDTSGLVQNAGTITASDPSLGIGVYLGAGTVDNGTATYTAAQIGGGDFGVEINGAGLVANDGTISGAGAAGVYLGSGTVNNGAAGDTTAQITSGPGDGVWIGTGTGIVDNFGTIAAPGGVGVYLEAGGTLTNGSSADTKAMITASFEGVLVGQPGSAFTGTIFNYATITANGDDTINSVVGVYLENGGSVENLGTASAINAVDWGVLIAGAGGFVQNAGSIAASSGPGPDGEGVGVDLEAGGTVDNGLAFGSTATIQGTYDGVLISGGAAAAGALVDNEGTIIGSAGVDFEGGAVAAAGTVVNDGLIESLAGIAGYAVVFGAGNERLVLDAGGKFIGTALGYEAPGSTTTLEFAGGTTGTLTWLATDSGTVTDAAGTFSFSAFGTIALDSGASWTLLTTAASTQTIVFQLAATPATLALTAPTAGTPSAVQATIEGFGQNGTIDLLNIANSVITGFSYSGSTLDVLGNGGTVAVLDLPGSFVSNSFTHTADTATTGTFITTAVIPCFAAGTAIRTARGEVRVQDLRIGDRAVCAGGGLRPVVWIGRREVEVARHPAPDSVAPVRVRRGAFADGVPCRDVWLSPDHAVFVDDALIPVRQLINGVSIAQIRRDRVTYFHVQLDRHDVLIAEGLPTESYLDTGNRSVFENAGVAVMLHPDFSPPERNSRGDGSCAPLMVEADRVEPIWRRLAARAMMSGHPPQPPATTTDPALRLVAFGRDIMPAEMTDRRVVFVLPPRTAAVRIVSRACAPSALRSWLDDRRRLGVSVGRIVLRDRLGLTDIPVDHPALAAGWHDVEMADNRIWRWTDGNALLRVPAGATMLELHLAGRGEYPATDAAGDGAWALTRSA